MLAVVFDMDGVLLDTESVCRKAWYLCGPQYGIKASSVEPLLRKCVGSNQEKMKETLYLELGMDFPAKDFLQAAAEEIQRELKRDGIPIKKGALEILTSLSKRGARLALASSTRTSQVEEELSRAGLYGYFHYVIGGDRIKRSKPDPEIYLKACQGLGVLPEETYAVEDSYNGVRSASRAGLKTLMVPDILEPTEEMEELAEGIFRDLFGVKSYLEQRAVIWNTDSKSVSLPDGHCHTDRRSQRAEREDL